MIPSQEKAFSQPIWHGLIPNGLGWLSGDWDRLYFAYTGLLKGTTLIGPVKGTLAAIELFQLYSLLLCHYE